MAEYRRLASGTDATMARSEGDADQALASAAKTVEGTFEFPYLAHAALEPLNAVARMQDGVLEVWGGHQIPDLYQCIAAQIAGVPPGACGTSSISAPYASSNWRRSGLFPSLITAIMR